MLYVVGHVAMVLLVYRRPPSNELLPRAQRCLLGPRTTPAEQLQRLRPRNISFLVLRSKLNFELDHDPPESPPAVGRRKLAL